MRRQRVWDWYTSTAYTRLMPGGAIVLIQTRWHEDDLAGRLLALAASGAGDRWDVLDLPAVDAEGRALWRDWYDESALSRIRLAIGPRDWSALYQQRPTPEDGDYFRAEWLKPYLRTPPRDVMRVYGGSDYAVTADGGDYTVHAVVGLDPEGRMHLLDLWRKQASSDAWIEAFCDLVERWRPLGWAEEQGQIKAGVGPFLERRMRERKTYVARDAFAARGDKAVRAQSMRGRMALDGLYVPVGAPWYPALRGELLSFPAGKHDDQVDALGLVGQLLDRMIAGPARAPKPADALKEMLRPRSLNELLEEHDRAHHDD
jgi:predicted phage terminase large subunit-like protein